MRWGCCGQGATGPLVREEPSAAQGSYIVTRTQCAVDAFCTVQCASKIGPGCVSSARDTAVADWWCSTQRECGSHPMTGLVNPASEVAGVTGESQLHQESPTSSVTLEKT